VALNPLDRQHWEYIWAMGQLDKLTNLDDSERNLVNHLVKAVKISMEDFNAMRHVAVVNFNPVLMSVLTKARAAGIGKEWPS
jgi:hypothetical protein